jgi:hypothetical protein
MNGLALKKIVLEIASGCTCAKNQFGACPFCIEFSGLLDSLGVSKSMKPFINKQPKRRNRHVPMQGV